MIQTIIGVHRFTTAGKINVGATRITKGRWLTAKEDILQRCKTCGREYTVTQTMTYSVYGYCSWDCLMNKKTRSNPQPKANRRNGGPRHGMHGVPGQRKTA